MAARGGRGVRLGVDMTMPRVPKVFEPKEKWNLDFTEEDFADTMASNYKSAEENAAIHPDVGQAGGGDAL